MCPLLLSWPISYPSNGHKEAGHHKEQEVLFLSLYCLRLCVISKLLILFSPVLRITSIIINAYFVLESDRVRSLALLSLSLLIYTNRSLSQPLFSLCTALVLALPRLLLTQQTLTTREVLLSPFFK